MASYLLDKIFEIFEIFKFFSMNNIVIDILIK